MVRLLLFSMVLVSFTSCITAKRYAKIVNKAQSTYDIAISNETPSWYTLKTGFSVRPASAPTSGTDANTEITPLASVEKVRCYLIPTPIYYGWNFTHRCELDEMRSQQLMKIAINDYADSTGLRDSLGSRTLLFTVNSMPRAYQYMSKGFYLFLPIVYFYNLAHGIYPEMEELDVRVEVIDGNSSLDLGNITIKNQDKHIVHDHRVFAPGYITEIYISNYVANLNRMTMEMMKAVDSKL